MRVLQDDARGEEIRLKVKELIAKLHDEDPEADVHFAYRQEITGEQSSRA